MFTVDHTTTCPVCAGNFFNEFGQYGEGLNGQTIVQAPCGCYYHGACGNAAWTDVTHDSYDLYYQAAYGYMLDK